MIFKTFRTAILFRIILLFGGLFLTAFLVDHQRSLFYESLAFLLNIAQVSELILYIQSMEKEIIQFTEAVKYRDFTQFYNIANSPVVVKELRKAFNEVNRTFRKLNAEKETQYQHLRTILELIDTGILSFTEDDEIKWMNEAFRKIFSLPTLKHVSGLVSRNSELQKLLDISESSDNRMVQLSTGKTTLKILVSTATFKIDGQLNYLMAIKNINEAVDETETLAWQKLLRVLTHEIMNSVAPITSLAETLKQRLVGIESPLDPELLDDMRLSIEVIRNRSEGLMKFAETYRSLSKVSQPTLTAIYVKDLFNQMERLMRHEFEHNLIQFKSEIRDPGMTVDVDVSLIEQVLLNLILNACDAVKNQTTKKIKMIGFLNDRERVVIQLIDNGPGIPDELRESIFVPFFTTKKHGSGIGLSLSKQIMQLHKGSISIQSESGVGTNFQLTF